MMSLLLTIVTGFGLSAGALEPDGQEWIKRTDLELIRNRPANVSQEAQKKVLLPAPFIRIGTTMRADLAHTFRRKQSTLSTVPYFQTLSGWSLMRPDSFDQNYTRATVIEYYEHTPDDRQVRLHIRPEARFYVPDGVEFSPREFPVRAEDVVFSLQATNSDSVESIGFDNFENVERVAVVDSLTVQIDFKSSGYQARRDLYNLLDLPLYAKSFHEKYPVKDLGNAQRIPTVGAYMLLQVQLNGSGSTVYRRIRPHWADQLSSVPPFNYDEVRVISFSDRGVAKQALKGGGIDFFPGISATEYANEFMKPGTRQAANLVGIEVPIEGAYFSRLIHFNLDRPIWKNAKLREALVLAYLFESDRRILYANKAERIQSLFPHSPFERTETLSGDEQRLVEELRQELGREAFDAAVDRRIFNETANPLFIKDSDYTYASINRQILERVHKLLNEAGYPIDPTSHKRALRIEFISPASDTNRSLQTYVNTLDRLGIELIIRPLNGASLQQAYINRQFDMSWSFFFARNLPFAGDMYQRLHSSSSSKARLTVVNPVVDSLVERLRKAGEWSDTVAIMRLIDRIVMFNFYFVPTFTFGEIPIVYNARLNPETELRSSRDIDVVESWH